MHTSAMERDLFPQQAVDTNPRQLVHNTSTTRVINVTLISLPISEWCAWQPYKFIYSVGHLCTPLLEQTTGTEFGCILQLIK